MHYKNFCKFIFIILISSTTIANAQVKSNLSIKRNIATCILASVGGAILGLSTLSFYGNPQERSSNVTTGAILGLVAGAGSLIYHSSQLSEPSFETSPYLSNREDTSTFHFWIDTKNQKIENRPTIAIQYYF